MSDSINQVVLNFLDRMIDENIRSAEILAALKSEIHEQRGEVDKILRQFQNGFRTDIKTHVSQHADKQMDLLYEIKERLETKEEKKKRLTYYDKIEDFIDKVQSPKTWISLFVAFVVGIATLIGGIATLVYKLPAVFDTQTIQTPTTITPPSNP